MTRARCRRRDQEHDAERADADALEHAQRTGHEAQELLGVDGVTHHAGADERAGRLIFCRRSNMARDYIANRRKRRDAACRQAGPDRLGNGDAPQAPEARSRISRSTSSSLVWRTSLPCTM